MGGVSIGSAGALMKATGVTSTIFTDKTDVDATMRSSSTLSGVNLFNGLIIATTIGAVAEVDANSGKIVTSSAASTLVGLKIAGNTIASDIAPGSTRTLPKLGTVTIKKFDKAGNGVSSQRLIADMLTINITQANSYLPIGSKLIVGHAQAFFGRQAGPAWVGGQNWPLFQTGTLLEQYGFQAVSCDGTAGKTHTAEVGPTTRSWISLTSAKSTAIAGPQDDGITTISRTTTTTNGGSMLGGVVTFDSIATKAEDRFAGGNHVRTTDATFVGLRINGQDYADPIAPNGLEIQLPDWGKLRVNQQTVPSATKGGKTRVDGLYLLVTNPANPANLTVGTQLFVAHSEAIADR